MKIEFKEFSITPLRIECLCRIFDDTSCQLQEIIFFNFSSPATVSSNAIAVALSTLCIGNHYTEIIFDLDLSSNIINKIGTYCSCNVICRSTTKEYHRPITGDTILLNFSGGFDSLAALQLMPEDTKLVSLNFGRNFEREYNYFSTFDPYIVTTNIRELRLTNGSWSFMGIAAILYCETLNAKYISFGTIFEASTYHLFKTSYVANQITFPAFEAIQLINAAFVNSLTEVATALILASSYPDKMLPSLESLAPIGSTKYYRKQLLTQYAMEKLNLSFILKERVLPKSGPISFGRYFGDDYLCPYLLKRFGKDAISPLMKEIPDEIYSCSRELSLTLYERYLPDFVAGMPSPLREVLLSRLSKYHILPYTDTDYMEFDVLKKIYSHYYK